MVSNVVELVNATWHFQTWKGFLPSFVLLIIIFLLRMMNMWRMRKGDNFASQIQKFPGPVKFPFVGSIPQCLRLLRNETEFIGWTREMVKKYGEVFRIWSIGRAQIFIASSDLAIRLLKEGVVDDKTEDLKNFAVAIHGVGLVALDPETHTKHRKFWNPFFNWRKIESSMPYMNLEALKLVKELEQFSGNELPGTCKVFDLSNFAIRCTFNITCCNAFGNDFMSAVANDVAIQHVQDLHTVAVYLTRRGFRTPLLSHDKIYYNTPDGRQVKRCAERALKFLKEAISFRRKLREGQSNKKSEEESKYFVDRLLDLREEGVITETQLIGELNGFVAGAYDTSGIVISVVMYYLALYPEHQEKVVEELRQVLGSDFGTNSNYVFTWDNVKLFYHLELCIKESLRLLPLVPALPRRSTQDIELEDGRVIPGGVDVYILTDTIHRDPKYFPDPDVFKPERHLEGSMPAFMPFSIGNRNCVGQVLGMVTVKTILAHLLMAYKWETTESREELKTLFITLQVPASVKCKIRKRTSKICD